MFKGVFTALVTPFDNGKIDFTSLEKLVVNQLESGIEGFVVCGTTGESATLTEEEQLQVLAKVCELAAGKIPILFGSGSNCTKKTLALSLKACEHPIDGLLVVVPYYNKPPQSGLISHFETIANNVSKPIVLYNVPGRTITELSPESIITLSQHPNIVGIKEANGDLNNFSKYKNSVASGFCLLSGDDESCLNFCLLGGQGVISVCSHLAPAQMVAWCKRATEKDESVRDEFRQQQRWIKNIYIDSNPIPVKAALAKRGLITNKEVRLPLVSLSEKNEKIMLESFKDFSEFL